MLHALRTRLSSRTLAIAFYAFVVAHAVVETRCWQDLRVGERATRLDYRDRFERFAFHGFPLLHVQEALDARVPAGQPVRLGKAVEENPFLLQRVTAALYPRPVSEASELTLDLLPAGAPAGEAVPLVQMKDGRTFTLRGPVGSGGAGTPSKRALAFSLAPFLLLLAGILGLGTLLARWIPARWSDGTVPAPFTGILLVAGVVAGLYSFASWVQVPLGQPGSVELTVLGVALLLVQAPALSRWVRGAVAQPPEWLRRPETLLLALFLVLFLLRMIALPVYYWDGRSIWVFHAHELSARGGMLALWDATHHEFEWSHQDYPLLLPAWLAHFSSLSGGWNERMATLGIPVLYAGALGVLWPLSRRRLGRWRGALFTAVLVLSTEVLASGGYADGLLGLLLVIQVLAFTSDGSEALAWIATCLLALLKAEGLVLAVAGVAAAAVLAPRLRARRPAARLLAFAPAAIGVVHLAWTRHIGLQGTFAHIPWDKVLGEPGQRAMALVAATGAALVERQPVLLEGLVGLGVTVLALRRAPVSARPLLYLALVSGMLSAGFAYAALMVTPFDVAWHAKTALGRLLLHPGMLFLLAAFAAQEGSPTPAARGQASPDLASPGNGTRASIASLWQARFNG